MNKKLLLFAVLALGLGSCTKENALPEAIEFPVNNYMPKDGTFTTAYEWIRCENCQPTGVEIKQSRTIVFWRDTNNPKDFTLKVDNNYYHAGQRFYKSSTGFEFDDIFSKGTVIVDTITHRVDIIGEMKANIQYKFTYRN